MLYVLFCTFPITDLQVQFTTPQSEPDPIVKMCVEWERIRQSCDKREEKGMQEDILQNVTNKCSLF